GVYEIFEDSAGPQPYCPNLRGSVPHPRCEPGEFPPGLVLCGSPVSFAHCYRGARGQPITGALWPGETPDLVRFVNRGGNTRLAVDAAPAFGRDTSWVSVRVR